MEVRYCPAPSAGEVLACLADPWTVLTDGITAWFTFTTWAGYIVACQHDADRWPA